MSCIEENSAIVDKQQLLDMYHQAVNDAPYSFFYVNMNAKDINKMFHIRFRMMRGSWGTIPLGGGGTWPRDWYIYTYMYTCTLIPHVYVRVRLQIASVRR